MPIYISTNDYGDGTFLGVVGPFADLEAARLFMTNPILTDVRWDVTDIMSPSDYLNTFNEE